MDVAVERHGDAPAGARGDAGRHVAEREDQPAVRHAERVETLRRELDLDNAGAVADLGDDDVVVGIEALEFIITKRVEIDRLVFRLHSLFHVGVRLRPDYIQGVIIPRSHVFVKTIFPSRTCAVTTSPRRSEPSSSIPAA